LIYLKKQEQKLAMYEADSAVWNVMNVIAKNQSFNGGLIVLFFLEGIFALPATTFSTDPRTNPLRTQPVRWLGTGMISPA